MNTLVHNMVESGYRMRMVKISHLDDLKKDIEANFNLGNVDENLHEWLKGFYQFYRTSPERTLPERSFSSILIIASKSPLVQAVFQWQGKRHTFMMPPTYLDFISEPARIKECLENTAEGKGYSFVIANNLPNKLLAVRSGLGRYGRNNLCYIPGMGSYVLLTAFFTDMPALEDPWEPLEQMPACSVCMECVNKCPSLALTEERFAVHAERCLTYHNEFWGKPEFPEWIAPNIHNCLVGCLKCQVICPENKKLLVMHNNSIVFDEEETDAILGKVLFDELPEGLAVKLKAINLHVHYDYLARNLKALLDLSA